MQESAHMISGRNRRGFTLIELVVVIAIILILAVVLVIAIAAVMKNTKSKNTATAMEMLGGAWGKLVTNDQWRVLYSPMTAASGFSSEFRSATGMSNADTFAKLTHEQRAILLGTVLMPTSDIWEKSRSVANRPAPSFNPPVAENDGRTYRDIRNGWNVALDGWGQPMSFEFDTKRTTTGGTPEIVFISGGLDGRIDTEDDNFFWSRDKGFHTADDR